MFIKGRHWDVFDSQGSTDGRRQIQGIDESGVPDDKIIKSLICLAKKGDEEALAALWEVLDEDGLVNRILWAQAMGWEDYSYPEKV